MTRPGIVAAFDIVVPDEKPRALAFDSQADAAAFRRDFNVRQRLVQLSLRTFRGGQAIEALQEEYQKFKEAGLIPTLWRFMKNFLILLVVAVLAHAVMIYTSSPQRPPVKVVLTHALGDAQTWLFTGGDLIRQAGTGFCYVLTGSTVPAAAVDRCASLPAEVGEGAVRRCLSTLAGRALGN